MAISNQITYSTKYGFKNKSKKQSFMKQIKAKVKTHVRKNNS